MGIKTIVDSDGLRVHVGNTVDTKFQTLLANTGNFTVDVDNPFEKGKWDGSKWVEVLPTALEIWVETMEAADREQGLPRYFEDLITDNPSLTIHENIKTRYDEKVALRATKP